MLNTFTGSTDANPGSGGELDVNGNFTVGVANTNSTSTKNATTADLSARSNSPVTSISSGTFNVGQGANTKGTLTLASGANSVNLINVTTINVGVSGSSNANSGSVLNLGSGTNTLEANTIAIGTGKSGAVMGFVSGAPATASVSISGTGGTGNTNITIGNQTSGTATGNTSSLLLAGHIATVQAGTVMVAQSAGNSGGTATATATFDTGTFNASTLNVGIVSGSTSGTAGANGTFTLGGAAQMSPPPVC